MRIKKVLILTYDLNLNQTSSKRYLSFVRALSNRSDIEVLAVGICFPFKSHPINSKQKSDFPKNLHQYISTITPSNLNLIQKALVMLDKKNSPYFIKKILLAVHILFYKVDQWYVHSEDLDNLNFVPDVVIAGGSGGIIKTSYHLANKHHASLILDYRDPWNYGYSLLETNKLIYYYKIIFTRTQELRFLNSADKIITVSKSLKSFFPKAIQKKIIVIENGSNFDEIESSKNDAIKRELFLITYLGTLYNDQLLDESFFAALTKFINENKLKKEQIKLLFLGSQQNLLLPKIAAKYELSDYLEITDRKETTDLLPYLQATSIFLHLKYGTRSQIITSKQADYLMFRKPILLPNSDYGDIEESIRKYNAGYVCDGTIENILNVLQKEYDKFLKGEPNTLNNRDFTHLSRHKIAEKLLDIIP